MQQDLPDGTLGNLPPVIFVLLNLVLEVTPGSVLHDDADTVGLRVEEGGLESDNVAVFDGGQ